MNQARRQRYLSALGIQTWRLRGPEDAAAAVSEPPEAVEAPPRRQPPPQASAPAPAASPRVAPRPVPRPAPVTPAEPRPAAEPVAAAPREVPADWDGLRAMVRDCRACKLCTTRTQSVFGVGDEAAPLLVVGEGPGADEDAQGEPFVGRAGKLLDEMLRAIGRSRGQADPKHAVFIANVVKCRPPGNRDPEADEVEACRPYLDRQIELIKPRLIVALGRVAAQRLLSSDQPLSRLRGAEHRYGPTGTPVFVTYHPAYLLRSPREKAKSWADLKVIYRALQEPA
ncbi:MAG: uracil-DNA glycosylase [Nevskiales bacterium]|nr:uracil-DNA glycosylase [Nevskiales bacterium]